MLIKYSFIFREAALIFYIWPVVIQDNSYCSLYKSKAIYYPLVSDTNWQSIPFINNKGKTLFVNV